MLNLRKNLTRFSKLALAAVVAVPAIAMTMPALAAKGDATSKGSIEFKANSGNTDPVNPIDPDDKDDKNDPDDKDKGDIDPTPVVDGLSFVYVSNFNFGQNDIETVEKEYYDGKLGKDSANVQIEDGRGAGSKWTLNVKMDKFKDASSNDSLDGAKLYLKNGLSKQVTGGSFGTLASIAGNNIEINSDSTSVLVAATKKEGDAQGRSVLSWQDDGVTPDSGEGTEVNRLYDKVKHTEKRNKNVALKIPAGKATAGTHTTNITWSLTDAPTP